MALVTRLNFPMSETESKCTEKPSGSGTSCLEKVKGNNET